MFWLECVHGLVSVWETKFSLLVKYECLVVSVADTKIVIESCVSCFQSQRFDLRDKSVGWGVF